MTTNADQAREAAEQAKQAFFELDEMSAGYGSFDLRELQGSTRELRKLLSSYRSGRCWPDPTPANSSRARSSCTQIR